MFADLRVVTALVALYRACCDEKARARALELVPDLGPLVANVPAIETARIYVLRAYRTRTGAVEHDVPLDDGEVVVCRPSDLRTHERAHAERYPFADVRVVSRERT